MSQHLEDLNTVKRILDGDRRAFDGFFAANMGRLHRFVTGRVRNRADIVEDLVQDIFCNALRGLASYRGEASLFTWLCQIARNAIADHYRSNPELGQMQSLREDDEHIAAALASLYDDSRIGPEDQRAQQEVSRLVQVALDALPAHYADVLEWKYIEGHSVAEISARMQQSPVQTQSVLARARNAFRDAFKELTAVTHG